MQDLGAKLTLGEMKDIVSICKGWGWQQTKEWAWTSMEVAMQAGGMLIFVEEGPC